MSAYILDTETTGQIEPVKIIQTAITKVEFATEGPHKITCTPIFTDFWDPGKPIEAGAWVVHGISDIQVKNEAEAPSEEFWLAGDTEYLIGHNIDYDWGVLPDIARELDPNVKRICTLALARKTWPHFGSHKLLAIVYEIAREEALRLRRFAHHADTDVALCLIVLNRIVEKLGITSFEELYQASEKARIPDVMPFGKHKGVRIKDVPRDYISWLLRQPDLDPYLKKAIAPKNSHESGHEDGDSIGAWWDPTGEIVP